jgi:predicted nucleotidyltransferase
MAARKSPNRVLLEEMARQIAPLLPELVFVGGHVTELLVTDPAATRPRVTDDVDVIVAVTTRSQYHALGERLRDLQLRNDTSEGAPICRWRTVDGMRLDVMPIASEVLGFSNAWYPRAIETAADHRLARDLTIRIATAPAFVATKWAAFADRGQGDALSSHDFEDIITVVAGRPELPNELAAAPDDVRLFISGATRDFLGSGLADYAVEGALPDARLIPGGLREVMDRLARIAALG